MRCLLPPRLFNGKTLLLINAAFLLILVGINLESAAIRTTTYKSRSDDAEEQHAFAATNRSHTSEAGHQYGGISGLHAIVTGIEHSGTSITGQLLFNAPCVIGAWETGFLLADTPAEIESVHPWIGWHWKQKVKTGTPLSFYNLTDDDIGAMKQAKDFGEMLDILRGSSHLFNELKDETYCQKPYQMIDKTPRYVYPKYFEKILLKTPGVPVIVLKKPYEKLKQSWKNRNAPMPKAFYDEVYDNVEKMIVKYPNRTIRIIDYNELMSKPSSTMQDVHALLNLVWNPSYLNMTGLHYKFSNYGPKMAAYIDSQKFVSGKHSNDLRHKNHTA